MTEFERALLELRNCLGGAYAARLDELAEIHDDTHEALHERLAEFDDELAVAREPDPDLAAIDIVGNEVLFMGMPVATLRSDAVPSELARFKETLS